MKKIIFMAAFSVASLMSAKGITEKKSNQKSSNY